jgi:hypothetical protein
MQAKQRMECSYDLCPHGGIIRFGEEITWNRKAKGERYHVDCFVSAKGLSEYAPVKHPSPAISAKIEPVSFDFDQVEEIEVKEEKSEELRHYLYPLLKHYVQARQHVYLWGAPGSGKSHVARQIAEELGLQFSYISVNPQSPASLLLGYMDAHGVYRESELFRRWRDGGVFLFDEQDNCSSSLLTVLNGMLASDLANFPCGMVPKHKDFIFVGTGNTSGRGGDWQFPERRKIDEASIDRLAFIQWGYDAVLELALALKINGKTTEWVKWIQAVRAFTGRKENGVKGGIYATPRSSMAGAKDLLASGPFFQVAEIAERHVWKGADRDTVARIVANVPLPKV